MQQLGTPLPSLPRRGRAMVVFVRPSTYASADKFPILDERSRLLGVSTAGSWFEVQLPPGRHAFFADAGNVAALRASLAPEKTYFVEVASRWGLWGSRVQLLAIAPRFESWQDREIWLAHTVGHTLMDPDAERIHRDAEQRAQIVARGFELLAQAYDADELDQRTLQPGDGI